MSGDEKSDRPVVPAKALNKAGLPAAEAVEGRGLGKENADSSTRPGHSAGVSVPSGWIACAESQRRTRMCGSPRRLRAAYWALEPKAVLGVDGVTWEDDGEDLEANLRDLHARVHRGAYRARPSRRAGRAPTGEGPSLPRPKSSSSGCCQEHESTNPRQDRTGQDRTGQDRTGQDRTGQDRTGQDSHDCVERIIRRNRAEQAEPRRLSTSSIQPFAGHPTRYVEF
jgi:hypothetical protein